MSAKILINGLSGTGKSSLVRDLKDAFVISRDGKTFPFEIPHMLIPSYLGMEILLEGGNIKETDEDGNETEVYNEGVLDKLAKYHEKYGVYPKTVVVDSVSKLMQDAIDYANLHYTNFDVHSSINREIAVLTRFVQETLVANDINVILINHVMENDKKGYVPVGQGQFKNKGGFFSEVDNSVLVESAGDNYWVKHRGTNNQARTLLNELPDKQYLENFIKPEKSRKLKDGESYYSLQAHIDMINAQADKISSDFLL